MVSLPLCVLHGHPTMTCSVYSRHSMSVERLDQPTEPIPNPCAWSRRSTRASSQTRQASLSCPWPTGTRGGKGQGQAQVQGHILFSSVPTHFWLLPRGLLWRGPQAPESPAPSTRVPPTEWERAGLWPPESCDFSTVTFSLCASFGFPTWVHFTRLK